MTVREGIRVLRQNGTLRARQGIGVFVGDGHHETDQPLLRQIDVEIPEGQDLLAVATISLDREGQYQLSVRNVIGAPLTMTPKEQANALRLLATGVEAAAVGREERL